MDNMRPTVYVYADVAFVRVTLLIHMCIMTYSFVLYCVVLSCSVLQCVTVCCSVLQCVAV